MSEKDVTNSPRKTQQSWANRLTGLGLGLLVYFGLFGLAMKVLLVLFVVLFCLIGIYIVLLLIFEQAATLVFASLILPAAWLSSIDDFRPAYKAWLITVACVWVCTLPWIRGWTSSKTKLFGSWPRPRILKITFVLLGISWLGISFLNRYSEHRIQRFEPSRYAKAVRGNPKDFRIGIALSGGGYRAAVFHAGVVSALEHFHLTPTLMSSVSGGSIFASYYALGGDPNSFPDLVSSGRFRVWRRLTYADALIPVAFSLIRRSHTSWDPGGRVDLQARVLDEAFLGGRTYLVPG